VAVASVSVIIPVYNGAALVTRAVNSALRQRDVSIEVLVIDDGSTDETPAVLAGFGGTVRVVRQANAGHVRARNRAARMASGEWLAFLDADDEWLPEKLVKQLAVADEKTGMVYTERWNVGDIGRINERQSSGQPLWEGEIFEHLLLANFITVSSVIMRKTVFEELGGFDESLKVCEDWDLWLRYTERGGHVGVCREPLTLYRWHRNSMSNSHGRMCQGRLLVVQRALATPRGRKVSRTLARQILASAWGTSAWYAAPVAPMKAIAWYLWSALYWPFNPSVYKGIVKCCMGMA
jgi:glycosyltransferase involved in cell wall biosynthesis